MIQPIRKRHRLIWLVLAVSLPVLFALALKQTPENPSDSNVISKQSDDFTIVRELKSETESLYLVRDRSGKPFLKIEFSVPPKSAFPNVKANGKYLGTINSETTQYFPLSGEVEKYTVVVYDEITQEEILSAEF